MGRMKKEGGGRSQEEKVKKEDEGKVMELDEA